MSQTTPAVKPSVIRGDVVSITDTKITVNSADGAIDAILSAKTEFKRVSPDNLDFKAATASTLADISVGDKVVVTGFLSEDKKSLPARTVYLMTKSDISQKRAKDAEQWKTRGVTGKVTAVNASTGQVTVEVRAGLATTSMVLTPKDKATFLRYAPDSAKFDEAKPSSIGEINSGDLIRALGDKSIDGTSFSAEEVVTGAFQTIAGTIKNIDAEKNEVVITDFQTKKDVTILLAGTSVFKQFPAEMAERMAGFQAGGGANSPRPPGQGNAQVSPPGGGQVQPAGGQDQTPGGGRRAGFGARGGIDDMLDRFPNITIADLKVGNMIAIASTKSGTATDHIKAIKLLAGVEPFIKMAQASASGQRGQRGQGIEGGLSIPGLDGLSFP